MCLASRSVTDVRALTCCCNCCTVAACWVVGTFVVALELLRDEAVLVVFISLKNLHMYHTLNQITSKSLFRVLVCNCTRCPAIWFDVTLKSIAFNVIL